MNNRNILFLVMMLTGMIAGAQENSLWMRYPALSPDGKTIAFCYQGEIWTVPSTGGTATALTMAESYEYAPVWSHDGKMIAFASDRYGNFDVFVMPSQGGDARRLSYSSAREVPCSFSHDDSKVLFPANRQDIATNAQYPVGGMGELYAVPAGGGNVEQLLPNAALQASYNADGSIILYEDLKGYENEWRKHHTSSVTRDIWMVDVAKQNYTKLSTFEGEDRNPVFAANGTDFYFLSEKSGSFNVFKSSISKPAVSEQLTFFAKHPVRFLSVSNDNTLCFAFDGEVYLQKPGAQAKKVSIYAKRNAAPSEDRIVNVNEGFTEARLSPNGKEFVYVFRGEIFVSSMDGGYTKRITNTPYQERSVSFSPDGRSLVYAAEVNNSWNLYTSTIVRKEEPYFYASTLLKTETLIATDAEEFQPEYSPDGKEVAYLENRVVLKVINIETKASRAITPANVNYSYADGDQYFQWSPDGKWFLINFAFPDRIFTPEAGLVSADGKGEIINLTLSGYDDYAPKWSTDGKMMVWGNNRNGDHAQGGYISTADVYAMFFTTEAFDRFRLSKEEFALLKEQDEKAEKDKKEKDDQQKDKKKDAKKDKQADEKKDSLKVVIDFEGLTDRKAKLTINTSRINDWILSKDNEKLFYFTSFEKGNDLWVTDLRTKETKILAKTGVNRLGFELSKDGKFLFVIADGKPMKINVEDGKTEGLKTGGEMLLQPAAERNYIFDHAWRQVREKFYVEDLHGVDWEFYRAEYQKFLPFITNNYDFAEMLSEMLGELNASHTGCGYRSGKPNGDQTADLGVIFDQNFDGQGLKIAEVIEGGPLDKSTSKAKAGCIIEKIDGESIPADKDFFVLLNRKTGKLCLLSLFDPLTGQRWEESLKPVSMGETNELLYKRWVKNRRAEVDRLSNGKIGYVHVRSMDDASMRVVMEEALGRNFEKEALVVDTRFNGGGNIHEQLSDFLSGKKYVDIVPHGQYIGSEPLDKWVKPSVVLISESCYSDAHLFPVAYRAKEIGQTVGMPVPGTGTFVWWESQIDPTLVFGIPMGGWRMMDGNFCENTQFEPDIKVANDPGVMASGRDEQLEAAVKSLIK